MVTDRNANVTQTLDRLLRERLDQFDVPTEIRIELRRDILAFFQRPEQKPFGATVMTPEASMASDQAKKEGRVQPPGINTPKNI